MRNCIKIIEFSMDMLNKLNTPVIICTEQKKILQFVEGFSKVELNLVLAERLSKIDIDKRSLFVPEEFNNILDEIDGKVYLTSFEILFNPSYQIDVIKLIVEASRKRKIIVHWCGSYVDGKLLFATNEFADYHSYKIADYDITCVI